MSKLEELIQQYCPDGVEYKALKTILRIKNGKDYKHLNEGDIPVYGSGGVMTYVDTPMYDKPSVLIPRKGSIDKLYYVDTPFWNVDTVFYTEIDAKQVIEKYVFYTLQKEHLEKLNTAGGVPSLTQGVVNEVLIPVPPLPVQEEIVRILDNFTELQAELQAELQKRKLQYNYYLDNLLNFNRGGYQAEVKWMKMSEVFETITDYTAAGSFKSIAENVKYLKSPDYAMLIRTTDLKSRFKKGDFIYVSKSAFDYLWRVKMDKECIVMPNVGNCGEIYYVHPNSLPYDNCALAPNAILVRSKLFNNKYLSYCLQVECFQKQLAKITSPVGQSKFNKTELKKLLVPIPSLADQQKIVDILDRFDRLTTDLSQGLPAEIEKLRQQYEYYRDKLLTFKRKAA